jgi:hypothetical protein
MAQEVGRGEWIATQEPKAAETAPAQGPKAAAAGAGGVAPEWGSASGEPKAARILRGTAVEALMRGSRGWAWSAGAVR